MLTARGEDQRRRGVTLVEMVVSLTLTGIVLGMVAAIGLRQERILADLGEQAAVSARLREAAALLPIQLRAARSQDIREARDTSLEFRATIATAVVCDTEPSTLVLTPAGDGDEGYASFISPVEAGDSVWVLLDTASATEWRAFLIAAAGTRSPGPCAAAAPLLSADASRRSRIAITIGPLPAAVIGLPLRVTRPTRFSLYHSADGWYLGQRDWSNATARFTTIQPLAGPYLSPTARGLNFSYRDSTGAPLDQPVVDRSAIASIRIELRGQTRNPTRVLGAAARHGPSIDSTMLIVALQNRR